MGLPEAPDIETGKTISFETSIRRSVDRDQRSPSLVPVESWSLGGLCARPLLDLGIMRLLHPNSESRGRRLRPFIVSATACAANVCNWRKLTPRHPTFVLTGTLVGRKACTAGGPLIGPVVRRTFDGQRPLSLEWRAECRLSDRQAASIGLIW